MVFLHHLQLQQIRVILDSQSSFPTKLAQAHNHVEYHKSIWNQRKEKKVNVNFLVMYAAIRSKYSISDTYSTSDSDSDSKWKTEEVTQSMDDDSFDESESDETDFRSKEKVELNRINYRWVEWVSVKTSQKR